MMPSVRSCSPAWFHSSWKRLRCSTRDDEIIDSVVRTDALEDSLDFAVTFTLKSNKRVQGLEGAFAAVIGHVLVDEHGAGWHTLGVLQEILLVVGGLAEDLGQTVELLLNVLLQEPQEMSSASRARYMYTSILKETDLALSKAYGIVKDSIVLEEAVSLGRQLGLIARVELAELLEDVCLSSVGWLARREVLQYI